MTSDSEHDQTDSRHRDPRPSGSRLVGALLKAREPIAT
jgi:hypothetical protein